jgi:hypothetical protein
MSERPAATGEKLCGRGNTEVLRLNSNVPIFNLAFLTFN